MSRRIQRSGSHVRPRLRWFALPTASALGFAIGAARAQEPSEPSPESAAPSASEARTVEKRSTRKVRPAPTIVEIIDLGGERDTQAFAMGAQVGAAYLYNRNSAGAAGVDIALIADIGLGPGGARVPWTLEPFLGFAITYNALAQKRGHPNRFTEIGARVVYRFDHGLLEGRWASVGAGLVWTSTRPSSGYSDPSNACREESDRAATLGLDCSSDGSISPGGLLDLGFGLKEWTIRRARWGFGARVPIQLSAMPGFAAIGFFYAQVGTAL
jgi:hypothetical protein